MTPQQPLIEVSEHVQRESKSSRVAVIFDLDSTLFCVRPRTQAILRELSLLPSFLEQFKDVSDVLREIEVLPTEYSVRQILQRAQITESEALSRTVKAYWSKHFFSSSYLKHDELYPSADEYVTHLHNLGAHILYLTGREDSRMRQGTVQALSKAGFPQFATGLDSRLLMKPTEAETDEHFKVTVLKRLVHEFDHIWFFENEPLIIRDVQIALPQVHIVFVNSVHSGKALAPNGLPTILPDYRLLF